MFTPWIRHDIPAGRTGRRQLCLRCRIALDNPYNGFLPEGPLYEHQGKLSLITPLGNIYVCQVPSI